MSLDDEILALEREIREIPADAAKWDRLDEVILRSGRLPRRVFYVHSWGGEYEDSWDTSFGPNFVVRSQAVAFMHRLAVQRYWEEWRKADDGESYAGRMGGTMQVDWTEVVPPGGEALQKCPYSCPTPPASAAMPCARRDGHP